MTSRLALTSLPFDRAIYLVRIERLVDRYQTAIAYRDATGSAQRRPMLRLLKFHPTALQEVEAAGAMLESRLGATMQELTLARVGAPIPAAPEDVARARVLALADAEVFLIGLKILERSARRKTTEPIPDVSRFGVPIDGLAPHLVAYQQIPKAGRHRAVLAAAGDRHGVLGLVEWLLPNAAPTFVTVCPADSIAEGKARRFDVNGRQVAVFRDRGELFAIDDICPHRGGPLGKGDIEDGCVVCPLHGWAFELSTGRMKGSPGVSVPTYRIEVKDGEVTIGPPKIGTPKT